MPRFRFRLDHLTCISPRSVGEYADTVTVGLLAWGPRGEICSLASPLGMRGPRLDVYFQPGGTHHFNTGVAFSAGSDITWEAVVDIEDNDMSNVSIEVVVVNDRNIDDPYAVTKTILALAAAAGTGAIGAVGAEKVKESLGAVLAGGLGGLGGEAVKKLLGMFFSDWPECTGPVFSRTWNLNKDNFTQMRGQHTARSQILPPPQSGCRTPAYEIGFTIIQDPEQPRFGITEHPVSTRYIPIPAPGRGEWLGQWYNRANAPTIAVNVSHSTQPGLDSYALAVAESTEATRRVVVDGTFDPVVEQTEAAWYWEQPIVAKEVDAPIVTDGGVRILVGPTRWEFPRFLRPNVSKWTAGLALDADGVVELDMPQSQREMLEYIIKQATPAATLGPSSGEFDLILYRCEETFSDGRVRHSRPYVRYIRPGNSKATQADEMLARYSLIR